MKYIKFIIVFTISCVLISCREHTGYVPSDLYERAKKLYILSCENNKNLSLHILGRINPIEMQYLKIDKSTIFTNNCVCMLLKRNTNKNVLVCCTCLSPNLYDETERKMYIGYVYNLCLNYKIDKDLDVVIVLEVGSKKKLLCCFTPEEIQDVVITNKQLRDNQILVKNNFFMYDSIKHKFKVRKNDK